MIFMKTITFEEGHYTAKAQLFRLSPANAAVLWLVPTKTVPQFAPMSNQPS
jgi:hypothetical protein